MATYLDKIERIIRQNPMESHSFSSLRKDVKRQSGVTYNNRAYIAAIKRGFMKGTLVRRDSVNISLGMPTTKPTAKRMCDAYRASAERHREKRVVFSAIVGRRGFKRGSKGVVTVLLTHVKSVFLDECIDIDHVWVSEGLSFAPFEMGDLIRFSARVRLYVKRGGLDYKLFYPTNVSKQSILEPPRA